MYKILKVKNNILNLCLMKNSSHENIVNSSPIPNKVSDFVGRVETAHCDFQIVYISVQTYNCNKVKIKMLKYLYKNQPLVISMTSSQWVVKYKGINRYIF